MRYFPQNQDEELQRLAELMAQQDAKNRAVVENTSLPQVDPIQAAVESQFAGPALGLKEESALMGLPQQARFARGIHTPQDALEPEAQVVKQMPSQESQQKQQLPNTQAMATQPAAASKEPNWDALVEAAMRSDAQSRLIRGIERGTKELVGGLTLTKPDLQNLVAQETNEEGKIRGLQAAQRKYALDKQEADDNKAMKQARIDTDRMGKEAYAKQIEAQMQQMKLNADLKAKELEQQGKEAEAKDLRAKADAQLDAWYKKQMVGIGWKDAQTRRISAENKGEAADAAIKSKAALTADKNTEGLPVGYTLATGANPSKKQREDGTDLLAQSKDIETESKKLADLISKKGVAVFDPTSESYTLAKQSVERLKGAARVAEGLGVPTGPDMAILESLIGNPLSLKSIGLGQFKNIIDSNAQHYSSKAQRRLKDVYGIVPAGGQQQQGATGMVRVVRLSDGKSVMKTPENARAMLEASPDTYKIEE